MKTTSGVFNLRIVLAVFLCSGGALLAMLSLAVLPPSSGTTKSAHLPASILQGQLGLRSPVMVTEFSDFQCPYCKRAASIVEQVRQTYGDRVRVIFKHMPLQMHQYAFKAAQASVCAERQGKFWQYHDRLFAVDDLSADHLYQVASQIGLAQTVFSECMSSAASRAAVEKDIAEANQLGVTGTPTFLVNGQIVRGAASFEVLRQAVNRTITGSEPTVLANVQATESWTRFRDAGASNTSLALVQKASLTQTTDQTELAAAAIKTTSGLTLMPSTLDFGYQLVGTTGPEMVETVSNSNTMPVVIRDISITGRDATDFMATYNFTLPVRIPPGGSITINVSFTPIAPWRAGIRSGRLRLTGQHNAAEAVPLKGIGATCGGPVPACSSGCADTDGDGLNDAWETAGGVDLNNDGRIDASHDLLLSGADPNQPDLFVQYDWMDYGLPGNACNTDANCTSLGLGHAGETCTGPQLIPTAGGSCRYACVIDSDCTSRGTSHEQEICQNSSCEHTHDPNIVAPGALQAVVDQFAAHGINLHMIRGNAQPHSTLLSFRLLSDPTNPLNVMVDSCEGGSLASGDAGLGKYAESFFDLKQQSSLDKLNVAYHYMVFGHYSGCDTFAHCNDNSCAASCSYNPDGSPKACNPVGGQSGFAELSGNDFIVSFGSHQQDLGLTVGTNTEGGTFMHELGHNLGLHHGGGIDNPCHDNSQCPPGVECVQTTVGKYCLHSDDVNWKPNYLSVMNYRFQFTGIPFGSYPGDPNVIGSRLDYSNQTLPTGGNTPGFLDESNTNGHLGLNEPAGLGSGTADLTSFFDSYCDVPASVAPTDGPVDWSGNGDTTETNVSADLDAVDHPCGTLFALLSGNTDWPELSGIKFNYNFQCTVFGGVGGDTVGRRNARIPGPYLRGGELSPYMALHAQGDTPLPEH